MARLHAGGGASSSLAVPTNLMYVHYPGVLPSCIPLCCCEVGRNPDAERAFLRKAQINREWMIERKCEEAPRGNSTHYAGSGQAQPPRVVHERLQGNLATEATSFGGAIHCERDEQVIVRRADSL